MAITTLSKVKTITGITDEDDLIEALIPIVAEDYLAIRNKPFDTGQGLEITSGSTSAGSISVTVDSVKYPVKLGPSDNASAVARKIYDALHYDFDMALQDNTAIFKTPFVVDFEADDTGVTVESPTVETLYPFGAEMVAIHMIQYKIDNRRNMGVKSESLGDHSITYGESGGVYPKSITTSIKRYVGFK